MPFLMVCSGYHSWQSSPAWFEVVANNLPSIGDVPSMASMEEHRDILFSSPTMRGDDSLQAVEFEPSRDDARGI
jgi:hypothetical protein